MEFSSLPENCAEMRLSPYRKDFLHSYVFGVFPVIELADSLPSALFRIVMSSKISESSKKLLVSKAEELGVALQTDDKTIERLSPKENCFAIGVFRKFSSAPDPEKDHIVLVNPSDRGNLGGIIRSAVAFGFRDVVMITPCADLFDPHTVRSTMGALFRVRPAFFDSFDSYETVCGRRNFYPFMLKGSPMERAVPDRSLPCSLIFGNESSGLDDSYLGTGNPVRIMHGNEVDSLNLSVAAGIGMHWFVNAGSA